MLISFVSTPRPTFGRLKEANISASASSKRVFMHYLGSIARVFTPRGSDGARSFREFLPTHLPYVYGSGRHPSF